MLTHFSITQQGKRHIEKNIPCQDFSASKRIELSRFGCQIVIAAVADGVGSCEFSQFGSSTAVQSFLNCVEYDLQEKITELSDENILKLIKYSFNYALSQVEKEAENRELPFLEFDSTLTGIVYDGSTLWYGHIGDDGVVVLYSDGSYEMITKRHKGEEAHSLFPLREVDLWQFGKSSKEVASCVLMTDGVLDHCVDVESMGNRVYFPFLEPALTEIASTDEDAEKQRLDWDEYLAGEGSYAENFRDKVTDDISFVVVQNPNLLKGLPPIQFDFDKWDEDTAKRRKELDDALYADYRAYKAGTYKSPVKQATGYCAKGASGAKAVPQGKQGTCVRGQFPKGSVPTSEQTEADEEYYDAADTVIDDICSDAVEALRDVFKTAHSVGRFVRQQLTPKKRNNTSAQDSPIIDGDVETGVVHTNNDISDTKPGVQPQSMTEDVEDGTDGIDPAE